jgi:hypothetical protein
MEWRVAHEIIISPTGDAWRLSAPDQDLELAFASGARAEAEGRRLARSLAAAGETAELVVILRGGALAGRIGFPARAAA